MKIHLTETYCNTPPATAFQAQGVAAFIVSHKKNL